MTGLRDSDDQQALNRTLMQAIEADDFDGAFMAILNGADIRHDNDMPLRVAAAHGRTAMVQMLLDGGADYSVHDHQALRDAEENGFYETAGVLRHAGSHNPRVRGDFERSMADRIAAESCSDENAADFENKRQDALRIFQARTHLGQLKP